MYKDVTSGSLFSSLRSCIFLLTLSWISGMIFGISFSYCSGSLLSLMRGVVHHPVSIVGLGAVLLLPFLLSALAVFLSHPGFLMVLSFIKAFFFGACAAALDQCFIPIGWFVRMLLLFSDIAGIPVLFWLWLRCLSADKSSLPGAFLSVLIILLIIGSIDYLVIAPFLVSII